jgi:hypothetical protein
MGLQPNVPSNNRIVNLADSPGQYLAEDTGTNLAVLPLWVGWMMW